MKRNFLKKIGLAIIIILLIGGLFWLFSVVGDFFERYPRGRDFSRSSSTKFYEVNLRTTRSIDWDPNEPKVPFEWKLAVPRAFLISETGRNGSVKRYKETKHGKEYFINIVGNYDESLGEYVPVPVGEKNDP